VIARVVGFCRAWAKLCAAVLQELTREIAGELAAGAEESWLWKGKHVRPIDGFSWPAPQNLIHVL